MSHAKPYTSLFSELGNGDVSRVGGKNASLGEMTKRLGDADIRVPEGFATTAQAYREFLAHNQLSDRIEALLAAYHRQAKSLESAGAAIRKLFLKSEWPPQLAEAIREAYRQLARQIGTEAPDVAVRSSATAEDLPDASFAGQHESYLNIRGEADLLDACRRCLASLFTNRAIAYRDNNGFDHMRVALSVGVQRMVRADIGGAGVMFSLDTETGFPDVVLIDAVWGLGETVCRAAWTRTNTACSSPCSNARAAVPSSSAASAARRASWSMQKRRGMRRPGWWIPMRRTASSRYCPMTRSCSWRAGP